MQKQNNKERLLTIGEASEYLNVSIDTLRRWEKKGKLNALRSPGGHRYFATAELDTLFGKKYERDTSKGLDEKTNVHLDVRPQEAETKTDSVPDAPIIEDRPTRDIIIPQVQPIRVTPYTEPSPRLEIQEAYIEQQKISILTPTLPSQEIPEPQNTTYAPSKKSNVYLVLVTSTLILFVVVGFLIFYVLKSSNNILSPVP